MRCSRSARGSSAARARAPRASWTPAGRPSRAAAPTTRRASTGSRSAGTRARIARSNGGADRAELVVLHHGLVVGQPLEAVERGVERRVAQAEAELLSARHE